MLILLQLLHLWSTCEPALCTKLHSKLHCILFFCSPIKDKYSIAKGQNCILRVVDDIGSSQPSTLKEDTCINPQMQNSRQNACCRLSLTNKLSDARGEAIDRQIVIGTHHLTRNAALLPLGEHQPFPQIRPRTSPTVMSAAASVPQEHMSKPEATRNPANSNMQSHAMSQAPTISFGHFVIETWSWALMMESYMVSPLRNDGRG